MLGLRRSGGRDGGTTGTAGANAGTSGAAGTGGATGAAGTTGAGGTTGTGGAAGIGGATGTGGAAGTGGATGAGGAAGRGGATGTGGAAGTAGTTGRGGTSGSGGSAGATGSAGASGSGGRGHRRHERDRRRDGNGRTAATGGGGTAGSGAITLDQTGNPVNGLVTTYTSWLSTASGDAAKLAADKTLADNIITWQMPHGGFFKRDKAFYAVPWNGTAARSDWYGANNVEIGTIDNNGTVTEAMFLPDVYRRSSEAKYRDAARKAMDFLLTMQRRRAGFRRSIPRGPAAPIRTTSRSTTTRWCGCWGCWMSQGRRRRPSAATSSPRTS